MNIYEEYTNSITDTDFVMKLRGSYLKNSISSTFLLFLFLSSLY